MNTTSKTARTDSNTSASRYSTVMLVDDNSMDNFINKRLMESCGFSQNIITCQSGKEALGYLEKNSTALPDLIFLDINMPEMDGFTFLDEYEKLQSNVHQHCKVIMLSTSESFKDLNRANKNKFVRKFLNKPLMPEALMVINF